MPAIHTFVLRLFLLFFSIMFILFPGGNAAPDMTLCFIDFQNPSDFSIQLWVDRLQAVRYVFMYGRFAYMKLLGGSTDRGIVFDDILAKFYCSFFYSSFHAITP